jgi:hypothetical protein
MVIWCGFNTVVGGALFIWIAPWTSNETGDAACDVWRHDDSGLIQAEIQF